MDDDWPDIGHFILDAEHRPVKVPLLEWAKWYEANAEGARRVASTETELFLISTVFLGLNHNWGKGPALVFETMVFEREGHGHPVVGSKVREELDGECWRYATWDDALTGHATTVRRVQRLEAEAMAKVVRTPARLYKET